MKLVAILISLSIFSMAIVPCADGVPESHIDHFLESGSDSHNHSNEDDDCTPFCSCDCCSVSVTIPSVPAPIQVVTTLQYLSYSFPYTINYQFELIQGVWRPPNFC